MADNTFPAAPRLSKPHSLHLDGRTKGLLCVANGSGMRMHVAMPRARWRGCGKAVLWVASACMGVLPLQSIAQVSGIQTARVSVASDGSQANGPSDSPSISANGRYIAFMSFASNLVDDDENGLADVFWHDRDANNTGVYDQPDGVETRRVSVSLAGGDADGASWAPAVSGDGRYVAFASRARNLVDVDTLGYGNVYRHDTHTGTTELLSEGMGGVAANGNSDWPSINEDGRVVAFSSDASNLVQNDGNGVTDVFVHGLDTSIRRISRSAFGPEPDGPSWMPSLSSVYQRQPGVLDREASDMRLVVAFMSTATNLVTAAGSDFVDIYRYESATGQITRESRTEAGLPANSYSTRPHVSASGHLVTFASPASNLVAGDNNSAWDVFSTHRHDSRGVQVEEERGWFRSTVVSLGQNGVAGNANATDGQRHHSRAVFTSRASNLVLGVAGSTSNVYLRDCWQTACWESSAAANGLEPATTRLVSRSLSGGSGNGNSRDIVLASGNLGHVAFVSEASDLIPGDSNGHADIFVQNIDGAMPPSQANLYVAWSGRGSMHRDDQQDLILHVRNFGPGRAQGAWLDVYGTSGILRVDVASSPFQQCGLIEPRPNVFGQRCYFDGELPPGAVIRVPVRVQRDPDAELSSWLRESLVADIEAVTPDPYRVDNRSIFSAGMYACSPTINCPIDEFFCSGQPSAASVLPVPGKDRLASVDGVPPFVPDLMTYYRFRDETMRPRAFGERLIERYYTHAPEVATIIITHPSVRALALEALRVWEPLLHLSLLAQPEHLENVIIDADQVAVVEEFLDALSSVASGGLSMAISSERARLPGDAMVGRSLGDVLDEALGLPVQGFSNGFEGG